MTALVPALQKQALKQSSISVFIREPITHAHDNTEFDDTTISTDNMIKMQMFGGDKNA